MSFGYEDWDEVRKKHIMLKATVCQGKESFVEGKKGKNWMHNIYKCKKTETCNLSMICCYHGHFVEISMIEADGHNEAWKT